MIDEKIYKFAVAIFACNSTTIAWVLIKMFTKYEEMISPFGSYLSSLMIIHIVILAILIINKKKLIRVIEK